MGPNIMSTSEALIKELKKAGDKNLAAFQQGFFKTHKGGYGEGDCFLGIKVPVVRNIAKQYLSATPQDLSETLASKWHEARLAALVILVRQYQKAKTEGERKNIYDFYLKQRQYINNWDLVDVSCTQIVGHYLFDKDRADIFKLSRSKVMWYRRIAMVSTMYWIKRGDTKDAFVLAAQFLGEPHDLMHKACGWMLRECWKVNEKAVTAFIKKHYAQMPRTMLRYAIEKYPETQRKMLLEGRGF